MNFLSKKIKLIQTTMSLIINHIFMQYLSLYHDDIMPFKHFLHHWPSDRGIHLLTVDILYKWPVMQCSDLFFVATLV